MTIHRKNTLSRLKEKLATLDGSYYFSRRDLEDAVAVIDAQNDLLLKLGTRVKNLRQHLKSLAGAANKRNTEKEKWQTAYGHERTKHLKEWTHRIYLVQDKSILKKWLIYQVLINVSLFLFLIFKVL